MKDKSILSALKDGEIHSPFREKCLEVLDSNQDLNKEFQNLQSLSARLESAPEPDFEKSRQRILEEVLRRAQNKAPAPRKTLGFSSGMAGGFLLSWPVAAAAMVVLGLGALAGGYALKSSGLEISFRPPVEGNNLALIQESESPQVRTRQVPEIRVTVPKRFTLPAEDEGELLLSSFEGGW